MSHQDGIGKLWGEIGRRNVGRVALVYAGVAWGIVHMSTVMAEAIEIPHWVNRYLVFLLVLLAPVVIGFSWVYELTPEGFKRAAEAERNQALSLRTARRLDIVILIVMIALAGLYGGERFLSKPEREQAATQSGKPVAAGVDPARVQPSASDQNAAASQGVSIAVLPFLNLSGDPKEEYFSDGMTEEITSALAKVKDLKVVGRTSAFQFKGESKDLRTIGQALGAINLLEGSVRKAGNRVRITGQLIRTDDGTHIWTDSYDRDLKDVFAVQEDVAKAIAVALQVPLGLKEGEALVSDRAIDADSYQDYLRAKALVRSRTPGTPLDAPIALLEQVLARQPKYAPAWALLAQAYALAPSYDPATSKGSAAESRRATDTKMQKAEAAAHRAIDLDPRSANAYVALAHVQFFRGNLLDAEQSFKQALSIDSLNPDLLQLYSIFLGIAGRLKEAVAMREQLRALEPLPPAFNSPTSLMLSAAGDNARALAIAQASPSPTVIIAEIYAAMARYKEAADAVLVLPRAPYEAGAIEAAARLLRIAPAPAPHEEFPYLDNLSFVFVYVGYPERALEYYERSANAGLVAIDTTAIWQPAFLTARKTERFKALVRKMGLVDYWRARGWPDVCHPVGANDFACE